jgi:hypothetical protein
MISYPTPSPAFAHLKQAVGGVALMISLVVGPSALALAPQRKHAHMLMRLMRSGFQAMQLAMPHLLASAEVWGQPEQQKFHKRSQF